MSKDVKERWYDIILGPLVTEKSTQGSENNQVTFKVSLDASKPEIKEAVESLFEVKVKRVNLLWPTVPTWCSEWPEPPPSEPPARWSWVPARPSMCRSGEARAPWR